MKEAGAGIREAGIREARGGKTARGGKAARGGETARGGGTAISNTGIRETGTRGISTKEYAERFRANKKALYVN